MRICIAIGTIIALACLCGVACRKAPDSPAVTDGEPPWFVDATDELGLKFVHVSRPGDKYFMPALMGSGAALFDYDNDGRLDIYLLQNAGPDTGHTNRLFHQKADGTFEDLSAGSGLDIAGLGQGVAIGDVNNDGFPDVLITEYGRIRLFLNNGNGKFTDITREAGLDNPLWGTSAAFFDYDRDGWLDLVVANYVEFNPSKECTSGAGQRDFCTPLAFQPTTSRLFRNRGRDTASRTSVGFEDVSVKSGLATKPGTGLGVVCADFDGDGWPDIFIANDGRPNHLWMNQHDGTFREEGLKRGVAYNGMGQSEANMGIAIGDVDGDGLFDLFVTHLTAENHRLWKQGPRGQFQDRTLAAQLSRGGGRSTGFGTLFADFDRDGAVDLVLANGRVERLANIPPASGNDFWNPYREQNHLYRNDGSGKFLNISGSNGALCGTPAVARGLVCGDIDNDGSLDLLVTAVGAPARLYRNVAPTNGHWLIVRAVDPALKRDAYGAEVTIHAGAKQWVRWLNPAYSYLCSNDPRAHFGLGSAERVDFMDVLWPDGKCERFAGPAVDRAITVKRGEGKPFPP